MMPTYTGESRFSLHSYQFKCQSLLEAPSQAHPERMCYKLSRHPFVQSSHVKFTIDTPHYFHYKMESCRHSWPQYVNLSKNDQTWGHEAFLMAEESAHIRTSAPILQSSRWGTLYVLPFPNILRGIRESLKTLRKLHVHSLISCTRNELNLILQIQLLKKSCVLKSYFFYTSS